MIIDSVAYKRFRTLVYLLAALVRAWSTSKSGEDLHILAVIKSQLERLLCFSTHKAQNTPVSDSAHVKLIVLRQFHFILSDTEKHDYVDDVKHE
jgi:hypothetical protein